MESARNELNIFLERNHSFRLLFTLYQWPRLFFGLALRQLRAHSYCLTAITTHSTREGTIEYSSTTNGRHEIYCISCECTLPIEPWKRGTISAAFDWFAFLVKFMFIDSISIWKSIQLYCISEYNRFISGTRIWPVHRNASRLVAMTFECVEM